MERGSAIFVAGHRGLVGSALLRALGRAGYEHLVVRSRAELDLRDQRLTREFFETVRPEYVFLAAAKVGGIAANSARPAEFLFDNLAIQTNVIEAAYRTRVKKLLFLGSSCIYPRDAAQPIREAALLSGPLELTNEAYAVAKIAGIKLCQAYNREYGTNYLCAMPTNLFGPGDDYDLENSHVLPALIRKVVEAKETGKDRVIVWGTGTPRREFLYSDDLAEACLFLMRNVTAQEIGSHINVGVGRDISIRELAEMVCEVVGFQGQLVFDSTKPDGTPRKLLDVSRLDALGFRAGTPLRAGIAMAHREYLTSRASGTSGGT
jgi:GDP-L-fucose synthase